MISTIILVITLATSHHFLATASHIQDPYASNEATDHLILNNVNPTGQAVNAPGINLRQDAGTFNKGTFDRGTADSATGASFAQANTGNRIGSADGTFGQAGINVRGAGVRLGQADGITGTGFGQPNIGIRASATGFNQAAVGVGGTGAAFGQANVINSGFNTGRVAAGTGTFGSGQGTTFGSGQGAAFGSGQGATRVIEAPATPTVTNTITIDRFVTVTDLAFHSVPVTLTDLVVRTTTLTTAQAIRTPVDDRVALQTTVVIRPTTLTVTCSKYYYNVVTDVSVDHFTITHTSYVIEQVTYTTTATQISTYASTMVRTIVHTQRTTVTDYHTITNTVHGQAGAYYY